MSVALVDTDELARLVEQAVSRAAEDRLVAPALLDARGAADVLCLSKASIEVMAKRRSHGLPFIKLPNGRIRFERDALLVWAKGQA